MILLTPATWLQAQDAHEAAQAERKEQKLLLAKVEGAPDKARRGADLASANVKMGEKQVEEAGRRVGRAEGAVKAVEARVAAQQVGGALGHACMHASQGAWRGRSAVLLCTDRANGCLCS